MITMNLEETIVNLLIRIPPRVILRVSKMMALNTNLISENMGSLRGDENEAFYKYFYKFSEYPEKQSDGFVTENIRRERRNTGLGFKESRSVTKASAKIPGMQKLTGQLVFRVTKRDIVDAPVNDKVVSRITKSDPITKHDSYERVARAGKMRLRITRNYQGLSSTYQSPISEDEYLGREKRDGRTGTRVTRDKTSPKMVDYFGRI
jgi:hypothetical protein